MTYQTTTNDRIHNMNGKEGREMQLYGQGPVPFDSADSRNRQPRSITAAALATLESLETRRLLASVGLNNGVLSLHADDNSATNITVALDSSGRIVAKAGNISKTYDRWTVSSIRAFGGTGNDFISIGPGINVNAHIEGGAGNDTLYGGPGNDTIYGGSGNDFIRGHNGNDYLYGGSGLDTVEGGSGTDHVEQNGPDAPGATTTPTPDTGGTSTPGISLSSGILTLTGKSSSSSKIDVTLVSTNYIRATVDGASQTFHTGQVNQIRAFGGSAGDYISVGPGIYINAHIEGGAGNDTLYGGPGHDTIYGGAGNDIIRGYNGNDSLIGGSGSDSIDGGHGTNSITHDGPDAPGATTTPPPTTNNPTPDTGGTNTPGISLSSGILTLTGKSSSSSKIDVTLVSSSSIRATVDGASQTFTTSQVNQIRAFGGSAGDYISVGPGIYINAHIEGGGGNDTLYGGPGHDTIYGGSGNDIIRGYNGNDSLIGGSGSDSIDGGYGTNSITQDGPDYPGATSSPPPSSGGTTPPTSGPIALNNGVLTLTGKSSSSSKIDVTAVSGGIRAVVDGASYTFTTTQVKSIRAFGGSAGDYISVGPGINVNAHIEGGAGNDTLYGGPGHDTIYGGAGNDIIRGYNGNDSLIGGSGSDSIDGGYGTNAIIHDGPDYPGATSPSPSPSPSPTPSDNDTSADAPKPVISALTRNISAGQAVHVNALSSTLNNGSPLTARYEWDFGDSNGSYNKLVGFNAAHVYANPGTYTVTLRVTNGAGKSNSTSTTITVASANRKVYYVSNSGSDSNSGTSSSSPIKSWSKAAQIAATQSNVEILFKRGETFSITDQMVVKGTNVVVGAYGSGNRPHIRWTGVRAQYNMIRTDYSANQVSIQDLKLGTIFTGTENGIPTAIGPYGTHITIRNNEFENVSDAVNASSAPKGLMIQDNIAPSISGIRSYFVWLAGQDIAIIGNTVANSTREHIIRMSGAERVLVSHNNLTNLDRRPYGDPYDDAKGTVVVQKGAWAYVANNTIHGPLGVGPLAGSTAYKAERWKYAVFENNSVKEFFFQANHGAEHVMVRNNIFRVDADRAIDIDGYSNDYSRGVVNLHIINNTAINNSNRGWFMRLRGSANGITLRNNLYAAPNLTAGDYGAAPVWIWDSSLASFDHISGNVWSSGHTDWTRGGINWLSTVNVYSGHKTPSQWNAFAQVGDDYFTKLTVSSSAAPGSGTVAANGTARYAGVFTDFYGKSRPSSGATIGAVQL